MKKQTTLILFSLFLNQFLFALSPSVQLGFVKNEGQIQTQFGSQNRDVLYSFHSSKLSVQLRKNGFSYELFKNLTNSQIQVHRIDLDFVGSDQNCTKIEKEEGEGDFIVYANENLLNSKRVKHFRNIYYKNVYPNIDIEFLIINTNEKDRFKYNIILHPGADEKQIKLLVSGANKQKVLPNGSIFIQTSLGNLEEQVPLSYEQLPKGKMGKKIKAVFTSLGSNLFGLKITDYNRLNTAVIDPMVWSTYFGSTGSDIGSRLAVDKTGNVYLAGTSNSTANLATSGAHQTIFAGAAQDGFIAKFDTSGTLLWATYFGGTAYDEITDIYIDSAQNVLFCGYTASTTGIATTGAYQSIKAGTSTANDAFLGKFTPNGILLWSTYFGKDLTDIFYRICTNAQNEILATGYTNSTDFNFSGMGTHQSTLGGSFDILVAKFSSNGNLIWGTYYGGLQTEQAAGICTDINSNIYVASYSTSTDNIATNGAYKTTLGGPRDIVLSKFSNQGRLLYGTYYGGQSIDYPLGMTIDNESNLILVGTTQSSSEMAFGGGADSLLNDVTGDGFILKMDTLGFPIWCNYFGGNSNDYLHSVSSDKDQNIYVGGYTSSSAGIATAGAHQSTLGGSVDGIFAKVNKQGTKLFGSYIGGTGSDQINTVNLFADRYLYASGRTSSTTAIATPGAHKTSYSGLNDALLLKFDFGAPSLPLSNNTINGGGSICAGSNPNPINGTLPLGGTGSYTYTWYQSTASATGPWLLATGSNNLQNYTPSSITQDTWFMRSVKSGSDSILSNVVSYSIGSSVKAGFTINKLIQCVNDNKFIVEDTSTIGKPGFTRLWDFDNAVTSTERIDSVSYVMDIINAKKIRLIISLNGDCADTATRTVYFIANPKPISISGKDTVIWGNIDTFSVSNTLGSNYFWTFSKAIGYSVQSSISLKWTQPGDMQLSLVERNSGNCFGDTVYKDVHIKLPALGSNHLDDITQVKLYPNPSSQYLSISFGLNQKMQYTILNILGESVQTGIIGNEEKIDLQALNSGMYFLQLVDTEGRVGKYKIQVIRN
ncbi:MAG: SBBP repeat-containing protein [Bacteroidota bacterium]|nr:SBBP repeat-containing protein [Bacteroidota bacterium]